MDIYTVTAALIGWLVLACVVSMVFHIIGILKDR